MRASLSLLVSMLLVGLFPGSAISVPAMVAPMAAPPSQAQWEADVATVMQDSRAYLKEAVAAAEPGEQLALNLDIDNTMMASYYDRGTRVRPVYRLVGLARRLGVAVFVNSARPTSSLRVTSNSLRHAGYRGDHAFDGICLRRHGQGVLPSKKRCRASFRARGYRLVINVGNSDTDFRGGGYDRAYRLPNYDGTLK